jgi:multiple antibiotic resistance protein
MDSILDSLAKFHLVFLPLLVAMDPLSVLPFYTAFTTRVTVAQRDRVRRIALVTAAAIGLLFLGAGRAVFAVLGIEVYHFVVAGGVILFVLSLRELVTAGMEQPDEAEEMLAVVPIGTPLLVGPATISLLLVLSALYPIWLVVLAFVANVGIAWIVLWQGGRIVHLMGVGGLRAFNKVMYLVLAAIAVKLVTSGVLDTIAAVKEGAR